MRLERFSYSPTETEGRLFVGGVDAPMFTMEQPWIASAEFPAGRPFHSCIPEGEYELLPYERNNGQNVWCLFNPSLGIYQHQTGNKADRFSCLIHPGNVVTDSAGCILPGIKRGKLKGELAVLQSGFRPGYAMDVITKAVGSKAVGLTLTISQLRPFE